MANPRKKTLKSGRVSWEARYKDPAGRDRSRSFPTRREAVAFLDSQRTDVRQGDWVDPDDLAITLAQLAEEAAELAPERATREQHRYYAGQLGNIGDYPIGKLRHADMQRWMNALTEGRPWAGGKPLQPATARNLGVWVMGLLRQAVRDGKLKKTPAERLVLPEPAESVRLADIPTVEQVNQLMAVARAGVKKDKPVKRNHPWKYAPHPTFARIVGFMAGTGMRPSEICGLRWQDVSMDKLTIDVTAQASRDGKSVKPLKTASGRRVIPMSVDVAAILREQKRDGDAGPDGAIFGTSRGARHTAVALGSIHRKFGPLAMGDLTLYSLRHFYASRLIASGVSVKAVSVVMGHKTPNITLQVYTHLWPGDMDVVRAASSGFLRDLSGIHVPDQAGNVIDLRGQTG